MTTPKTYRNSSSAQIILKMRTTVRWDGDEFSHLLVERCANGKFEFDAGCNTFYMSEFELNALRRFLGEVKKLPL